MGSRSMPFCLTSSVQLLAVQSWSGLYPEYRGFSYSQAIYSTQNHRLPSPDTPISRYPGWGASTLDPAI